MDESLAKKEEEEAAGNSPLQLAIEDDDVDELYRLIEGDEKLLDHGSMGPFPNTPLHIAADKGKTKVAMEIAILKPCFAQKLNRGGHSPMHLALQKKHYDIVRALITLNPELIRVRGRGGITPLHFVAREKGDDEQELLELLAEFLCACESSIKDLTSRRETAIHVAVKNHSLEACKVLVGWLKRVHPTEILSWKDEDGNSVFKTAKKKKRQLEEQLEQQLQMGRESEQIRVQLEVQFEIEELLFGNGKVGVEKKAMKIFQNLAKRLRLVVREARPPASEFSLSQFLSSEETGFEKFTDWFGLRDESARNIILIVATLITTATYQAALSPPGGYWQDNSSNTPVNSSIVAANSSGIAVEKPHRAGEIILSGSNLYTFTILNSIVFSASILTIWITAIPSLPNTVPVYWLVMILCVAYLGTLLLAFPKSGGALAFVVLVICPIFQAVGVVVSVNLWNKYKRSRKEIDVAVGRVSNLPEFKDRK